MKKENWAAFAAAILFTCGFAMATGVDKNPMQAVWCIVCMAAAYVLMRYADRAETKETTTTAHKHAQKSSTVA